MGRAPGKHRKHLSPKIAHKSIYPLSLHWSCGWDTHSCSALLPAKDWGGRGAGASTCAHLHVTAWQFVVQLSPPFHWRAYVKPNPQISFMTVDSWQIKTPGNISKKFLTMTKQIWAYFTAITGSFAAEYQIPDTGEKKKKDVKDRALALWKSDIYSLISTTFLAVPHRIWVLGLPVACDWPCF